MIRFDTDRLREILNTLSRNKSRTFLTGFGVFWGVFMLVGLIGGGDGLKELINKNLDGFATNSAVVWAQQTTIPYHGFRKGRQWVMNYDDVKRLKAHVPELDVVTPTITRWGAGATHGDKHASCTVKGVMPDMQEVTTPKMFYGRYINEMDISQGRKVCVIGKQVYKSLFTGGGDPCGQLIRIDSIYYNVVGVNYSDGNMNINGSDEQAVVLPITLVQQVYNRGHNIDLLCMTGKPGVKMSDITDRIRSVIAQAHDVSPKDDKGVMIFNTEMMFSMVPRRQHTHLARRHRHAARRSHRRVEHHDGDRARTHNRDWHTPCNRRHTAKHSLANHLRKHTTHSHSRHERHTLRGAYPAGARNG